MQEDERTKLISAIEQRDIQLVRDFFKMKRWDVLDSPPHSNIFIETAVAAGELEIVKFLISLGDYDCTFTLTNAIRNNRLNIIRFFIEERQESFDARDYIEAFTSDSISVELLQYMFNSAAENGVFEIPFFNQSENADSEKVQYAAKNCLENLIASNKISLFIQLVDSLSDNQDFLVEGFDCIDFGLLTTAINHCELSSFQAIWKIAHQKFFDGNCRELLDGYCHKKLIDDLFVAAIRAKCSSIFSFLYQYANPDYKRCFDELILISGFDVITPLERE